MTGKFDKVCEDYALSKFASANDARLSMLEEIADLRAKRDELVAALRPLVDRDLQYLRGMVMGDQLSMEEVYIARAALSKSSP